VKILAEIVCEIEADQRLYDFCNGRFTELPSRKSVKNAIDQNRMLVNGKSEKTGFWLRGGERIQLVDLENKPPKPYHLDLEILFEDDHLIIVNKPAGIRVSGNQFKTLTNILAYNFTPSKAKNALPWPLVVHRLDQPTSGILIAAKSQSARIEMGRQFEAKEIEKTYHAIVIGETSKSFESHTQIDDKDSETQFETLKTVRSLRSNYLSLLKIYPKTGRKHQIRKHLSEMNFPILGDQTYSPPALKLKHKGLFLCATGVKFAHPASKKPLKVAIELPKKYEKRLKSELKRWKNTMQA
jgi:23S rRNA pseudouridine1911/1915/1917 synthase